MLFNVKSTGFQVWTSIFVDFMQGSKPLYTKFHKLSSLFMVMMLVWLTICLPYVSESQQVAETQIEVSTGDGEDDCTNPLSNTNEEKTEAGSSLLSEYLQESEGSGHNFISISSFYKCHPSDLYLAYHPDLIIPPPEA